MTTLVSRATLARIAGVSRAAITQGARGALAQACVGSSIDLDQKSVAEYIARHAGARRVPKGLSASDVDRIARRVVALWREVPTRKKS